jgi:hypothetical protein
MDFIESLFGIAPDGGDGSLEALIVVGVVAATITVLFRRRIAAVIRRWGAKLSPR